MEKELDLESGLELLSMLELELQMGPEYEWGL
jgi:hypothetical protein